MNVKLAAPDIKVLNHLSDEYEALAEKARLMNAQASMAVSHRAMYIRALLEKAGAPLDVNYRVSPDGTTLVPVEEPPDAGR